MTRPQLRRQPLRPQLAAVLESVSVAPVALPASSAVPQGGAAARAPSRGARVPARVRGMLNNTIFLFSVCYTIFLSWREKTVEDSTWYFVCTLNVPSIDSPLAILFGLSLI